MFTACRTSLARISSSMERIAFISNRHSTIRCAAASFSTSDGSDGASKIISADPSSPSQQQSSSTSTAAQSQSPSTRIRALSLYRQLLRGAERMPTPNRQNYVKRKTRDEYRRHMKLTNEEEIDFQLRLADTNLDTVLVQAEHLSR